MADILTRILEAPPTAYILSFGGLGLTLLLALNFLHAKLAFSQRVWGLATLGCGAGGGILIQLAGFVKPPSGNPLIDLALAAFFGAFTAAAASSFSAVDLRATLSKTKD